MKFAIISLRNKQDLPLVLIFSIMSGRKDTVAITLEWCKCNGVKFRHVLVESSPNNTLAIDLILLVVIVTMN